MARLSRAEPDPVCKLLGLVLFSAGALRARPLALFILEVLSLVTLIACNSAFQSMIKDTIYFMLLAFFTVLLKTSCPVLWTFPNAISFACKLAESTALFGSRLLVIFWLGKLLVRTTRVSELRDALTRLFSHIPLVRNHDLGLGLSNILGFIPLVFDEWRLSLEAARARGFAPSFSMPKWADFLVAFLRRLMVRAVSVPEAISARGRTQAPKASAVRLKLQDFVVVGTALAFALAAALRLV